MKSEDCFSCGKQPRIVNTVNGILFACPGGHYCTKHYVRHFWQANKHWNQYMRRRANMTHNRK